MSYKRDRLRPGFHLHYAIITFRGKLLAFGLNKPMTRDHAPGCNKQTMHAEHSVVKNLGDISLLRGSKLIVIRLSPDGRVVNSKPCWDCMKFLHKCRNKYGLSDALYSTTEGTIKSVFKPESSREYPPHKLWLLPLPLV